MVGAAADRRVQTVDGVGAGHAAFVEVWGAPGFATVTPNDVERLVAFVAGVALSKRAAAATAGRVDSGCGFYVRGRGAVAAGSASGGGFCAISEGLGAVFREALC